MGRPDESAAATPTGAPRKTPNKKRKRESLRPRQVFPRQSSVSIGPLTGAVVFPFSPHEREQASAAKMAPIVPSWSSLDYETATQRQPGHPVSILRFRPAHPTATLKSYGSVSSFESDPYGSLLMGSSGGSSSGGHPPAKPPRAYPTNMRPSGPFRSPSGGRQQINPSSYATLRSKSHSDLVISKLSHVNTV